MAMLKRYEFGRVTYKYFIALGVCSVILQIKTYKYTYIYIYIIYVLKLVSTYVCFRVYGVVVAL